MNGSRQSKENGKTRRLNPAQLSQNQRSFIDRAQLGDFRVGDWVVCRGAKKDRSFYTTEVRMFLGGSVFSLVLS